MKIPRYVQYLGGAVIAGVCLYIFFRGVDFGKLMIEFRKSNPFAMAAVAALSIISLWFRAIRWRILLPNQPPAHKRKLFGIVVISFMANNVLPARMGEAARVLLLWRKNGYPVFVSVGSIVAERMWDTLTLMAFFCLPVFLLPQFARFLPWAFLLSAIVAGCALCMVLYRLFPGPTKSVAGFAVKAAPLKIRPRIMKIGGELASNLKWLWDPGRVLAIVTLSIIIELSYGVIFQLLADKPMEFGLLRSLFVQAFAAVGAAIPLAPGYVGTIHATILQGCISAGLDENQGRAIAILSHALSYLPVTALGLWYLLRTDVTFKEISQAQENIKDKE